MHQTTSEVWDPYQLVILLHKSPFCLQKPQMRAGTIETSYSDARHPVLHAQNDRWGLGPIETCNFGANHDGLPAQNDKLGQEPIETYI